jgi:hypothetical protein
MTLSNAKTWREIPLASMPMIFAVQQAMEGVTWLELTHVLPGLNSATLANLFAIIALVIWPLLSPTAAILLEPVRSRRVAIAIVWLLAVPTAYYGWLNTHFHSYTACIVGRSISYVNGTAYPLSMLAAYVGCTIIPLLLSSHRALQLFGAILALGIVASVTVFYSAFVSVWCFFAASACIVLVLHFMGAEALRRGA